MRCSIMPDVLRPQLARCGRIASFEGGNKAAGLKPVYGYVSIHAGDLGNLITLRVQDPHVFFEGRLLSIIVEEPGEALVECDRLLSILKTRLDGHPITFSSEGEFLLIKQGEFRAKLPLLKGETIPPLPTPDKPYDFTIDFEPRMLAAVNRCGTVIEDEKSDTQFKGLLLDLTEEKTFRIAGFSQALLHLARFDIPETGGFRMSIAPRSLPLFDSLAGTLPMKLSFDRVNNKVICASSESSMSIKCTEDTYPKGYINFLGVHKMAEGQYPITKLNKDGLIQEETSRKVMKFRREEFINALGSAACVLGKEDSAVELTVKQKLPDGSFVVEMAGLNRFTKARASEKVLATSNIEAALSIGVHYQKMREALKTFGTDNFDMYVLGPADPIVLVEEGTKEALSFSIPLRIA
jgi:DNA polymerase III sliding clamp (beta) subunit (PCNA family)